MNKEIEKAMKIKCFSEEFMKGYVPMLEVGEKVYMWNLYQAGQYFPILDIIPYRVNENMYLLYSYKLLQSESDDDYINDIIEITDIQLIKEEEVDKRIVSYYSKFRYTFDEKEFKKSIATLSEAIGNIYMDSFFKLFDKEKNKLFADKRIAFPKKMAKEMANNLVLVDENHYHTALYLQ